MGTFTMFVSIQKILEVNKDTEPRIGNSFA
jgi:hypothetical protein